MITFETLVLRSSPNQFLLAPEGLCQHATPHSASPVYPVPVERLEAGWRRMLGTQPRVEIVATDEARRFIDAVQRSLIFRFKDQVSAQFFPAHENRSSTLAVYSRSEVGYSDLGVNRKRVNAWLRVLEVALAET